MLFSMQAKLLLIVTTEVKLPRALDHREVRSRGTTTNLEARRLDEARNLLID
jgi:hypothetical protein